MLSICGFLAVLAIHNSVMHYHALMRRLRYSATESLSGASGVQHSSSLKAICAFCHTTCMM